MLPNNCGRRRRPATLPRAERRRAVPPLGEHPGRCHQGGNHGRGYRGDFRASQHADSPIRDLAESTGGFLIGDSNDLRGPLRKVNEEISSYYELTFNPHIQNYDGSFRKLAVARGRKDLVIHARNGYFRPPA